MMMMYSSLNLEIVNYAPFKKQVFLTLSKLLQLFSLEFYLRIYRTKEELDYGIQATGIIQVA